MRASSFERWENVSPSFSSPFSAGKLWWVCLVLGALLWFGLACDTVAEITFTKESLSSVRALGFRAESCAGNEDPLSLCSPPGCGTLDFVLETNVGRFMTPNAQIIGLEGRLAPGTNFTDQDITFNRSWLFQLDANGVDLECTATSECSTGFECVELSSAEVPADSANVGRSLCARKAAVTAKPGSLHFRAIGSDPQPDNQATSGLGRNGLSLVLDLDNSGSLIGRDNGDGNIIPGAATDPERKSIAAVLTFLSELNTEDRSGLTNASEFGLFELAGSSQNGVNDVFLNDTAIQSTFTRSSQRVSSELQLFSGRSTGKTPVWESYVMAAGQFRDEGNGKYDRQVLTFADSGADGSSAGRTVDDAIAAMKEVEGTTTIVHLDSLKTSDSSLRTGPLSDYDQLACETGGYYIYDVYPKALDDHFRRLAVSYEAVWSLNLDVSAENADGGVTPLDLLDSGWYRLAASMEVGLGGQSAVYRFQLRPVSTFDDDTSDTRLLFHVSGN
ncbi:MAG: hypothetical protein AUK47_26900 [Deltaproteobacteria bacterium CG2_30_63_29]|nr:MAG: hypothetical protein AUK47_26900 [Deltaproteobacteria bacterium CG2_30_63_29]PIV98289.1 MAG: hypothetical protein COW42_15540 [Deltaproteobacteria bacterium CG17_big_fil_post_rev_8_21_14_2_50_63_7]PJB34281.1 MAG: hypothetical protein CO108_28715 [Deltaproteobacteria bacterium CG_4_9_14_3_um_filter_63_12]